MYVLLEERKGGERHLIQKESIYSKNDCFPARGSHEYNDKSKFHALFSVRNRLEKARESFDLPKNCAHPGPYNISFPFKQQKAAVFQPAENCSMREQITTIMQFFGK